MNNLITLVAQTAFSSADVVILASMIALAVRGAIVGIVRDGIFAGGIVISALLARIIAPLIAGIPESMAGEAVPIVPQVCYAVIFIILVIVSAVAARMARGVVRLTLMGAGDRAAGALFGTFLGLALCGIPLKLFEELMRIMDKPFDSSALSSASIFVANYILGMI
jgi:uncharacterized membrane protein required for colicin V production